jgi:outer membrane autotransporter protein
MNRYHKAFGARFVLLLSALILPSVHATPDTWKNGPDSQWDTGGNWSLGLKPTAADDAIFPNVVPITGSVIALGGGEVANTLTFHNNYSLVFGSLTLTTGTITADSTGSAIIGTMLTGAGSITKEGAGQILLDAANTYLGGTTLNAGTLLINGNSALGTGTLTINGGTFGITATSFINNSVVINADFNIISDNVLGFQGPIDLGGGSRTITGLSDGNGNNVQFNGVISNGTGLTFFGSTLTAFNFEMGGAGSNTYTGTTVVDSNAALSLQKIGAAIAIPGDLTVQNGGFVTFRATGQIAASSLITLNGGNLDTIVDINIPNAITLDGTFNQVSEATGTTMTLSGMISGDGPLIQSGDFANGGTLVITNSNPFTGGIALNNGSLYADNNDALGTGQLDIFGGTTFGSHVDNTFLPNAIAVHGNFSVSPPTGAINAFTLAGNVDLLGGTRTITAINGADTIFAGSISNGGVTFDSSATSARFIYTGNTANTYTGLTTVQNTVLVLDKSVLNGAIHGDLLINANGGVGLRANEQIGDTSTVTIESMGNLTLAGHTETIGTLLGSGDVLLNDGGGGPGGTFIIGAGDFSGLIHDDLSGGKIVKTGPGTLILESANTYTGGTTINGGALSVGDLNALGTGNVVVNGGTLQTFNGPRPIAVGGTYTQNIGGTLRLQIGGIDSGADSDFLSVTGGASLAGTLSLVRINNYNPANGDRVNIIGGPGGHTGVFGTVTSTFAGILQPTVHYDDQLDVYILFELNSFTVGGLTPNQKSVAHNLDDTANDPAVAPLINFLEFESLGNLPHDYDLIAPEELASIYEVGFSQAVVQSNNLQRRMDDIRAGSNGFCANNFVARTSGKDFSKDSGGKVVLPAQDGPEVYIPTENNRWGVFINGSGDFVNVGDDDSNAPGYHITTGDFTFGADYRVCDHFAVGINGGYASSQADLVNDGRVDVDGGKIGAYATVFGKGFFGGKIYIDGAIGGGLNSYDTLRTGLQDELVRGDTNGSEFNAMISYGSDWTFGCFNIGTWSTFQYTNVNIDKFTEEGSLAPLEIQDQGEDSIRGTSGIRASYDIKAGRALLRPEIRAAWQHEYGDPAYQVDSRLASGAGGIFRVRGPNIGRDAALVGAGLNVQWNNRVSTYVYYDGVLGRANYDNNAVTGGLRVGF